MAIPEVGKVLKVKLSKISVPRIRVKSVWNEEIEKQIEADMKRTGDVGSPLITIYEKESDIYWLVDGEQRLNKAVELKLESISVYVYGYGDEAEASKLSLRLGIKGNVDELSVAYTLKAVWDRLGENASIRKLAEEVNMPYRTVERYLSLVKLSGTLQRAIRSKQIGIVAGEALSGLSAEGQERIYSTAIAYKWVDEQIVSVANEAKRLMREQGLSEDDAITKAMEKEKTWIPRRTCGYCNSPITKGQKSKIVWLHYPECYEKAKEKLMPCQVGTAQNKLCSTS